MQRMPAAPLRRLQALGLSALVILGANPPSSAAPGDFLGGTNTVVQAGKNNRAYSLAVQADGKIVVAGEWSNGPTEGELVVARYEPDLSLDTNFNQGGTVTTLIGQASFGRSVVVQGNGGIVVAGSAYDGTNSNFALARYHPDGSLDTSFGSGGKVMTPVGNGSAAGRSMVLQTDGRLVVAGSAYNGTNNAFAVVRYNTDGSLDTTFGTGGKVTTTLGNGESLATSVALQSDGKIVAVGSTFNGTNTDYAVLRYQTNGVLDVNFGSGGKVITAVLAGDDAANGVAIQANGKIVVLGNSSNPGEYAYSSMVRYNANGSLDSSFNGNGKLTTLISSGDDIGYGVSMQSNGQIVATGSSADIDQMSFISVARYNTNGTLDSGFGAAGSLKIKFTDYDNVSRAVVVQGDGVMVVAGWASDGTTDRMAVARFEGLPPEINVMGQGVTIAAGDTTPTPADDTDFGGVLVNGATVTHTFTVQNLGAGSLFLTGTPRVQLSGPQAGDFSVTLAPASPVAPAGSTTFRIQFDPSAIGLRTATVSLANNDQDEGAFTFHVSGVGTAPPDQLALTFSGSKQATLTVTGPVGSQFHVEVTDSLTSPVLWGALGSITLTNGSFQLADPASIGKPARFYRIISGP